MKYLRILIDIDGIIADLLPYWLKHLNGSFPPGKHRRLTVEDITEWDLALIPPYDELGPERVYGHLNIPRFFRDIPIMPGAADTILQLINDGHKVYLVTARHGDYALQETKTWVEDLLPFIDTEKQLIFAHDKHLISADVLIDDKPETLLKYRETHPKALAMGIEYPYNMNLAGLNIPLFPRGPVVWGMIYGYLKAFSETPQITQMVNGPLEWI